LLTQSQRDRLEIVLVSPRNPLNIGAAARAMANFSFSRLTVVAPYEPHWREARSAVGAPDLLQNAKEAASLAEAVTECTFVAGTGTRMHRKPEQPVILLPDLGRLLANQIETAGRVALVFGPEKHGLTRDDLSYCQVLVEIPTDPRQPSMNLGQAVAVCLYELARPLPLHWTRNGAPPAASASGASASGASPAGASHPGASSSGALERLAVLIEQTMTEAGYSPRAMQPANRHDLRLLLRRLAPSALDTRRMMGLFRRILYRLRRASAPPETP
jgi:TrmH family RNA methyltransferase